MTQGVLYFDHQKNFCDECTIVTPKLTYTEQESNVDSLFSRRLPIASSRRHNSDPIM